MKRQYEVTLENGRKMLVKAPSAEEAARKARAVAKAMTGEDIMATAVLRLNEKELEEPA